MLIFFCWRTLLVVLFTPISGTIFNVKDFGASGDGKTEDTKAIRSVMTAAIQKNGGTVLFPPGNYLTAPFNLSDNVYLEIQAGATILGIQNKAKYPIIPPLPSYGKSRDVGYLRYQALVMAFESHNVSIGGKGSIDGQGKYWWDLHSKKKLENGRPRLVEIYNSTKVEISGVQLKNSGFWTLHPIYCQDVWIHNINITAPESSPNTDGIDPDSCQDVIIEHNFVNCGDDHIAIKSGLNEAGRKINQPIRNVTVRHNWFADGHGISIGSETSGGIFDVFIHDNVVVGPAKHGLNIKTAPSRGATIQNIQFWNMEVNNVPDGPILRVDMNYDHSPPAPTLPVVKNIIYRNVTGNGAKSAGAFTCLEKSPCINIRVESVKIIDTKESWSCSSVINGTVDDVSPKGLSSVFKKCDPK